MANVDPNLYIDVLLTIIKDLRMYCSQHLEKEMREQRDRTGIQRYEARARAAVYTAVLDQIDRNTKGIING